jgi:hypothetical protein
MRETTDATSSPIFRQFEAQRIFLHATKAISDYPALCKNADFKAVVDHSTTGLVLQMRSWCLSGRIPTRTEEKTVHWPSGVWQMFKHKFMPQWFTDRFPVLYESQTLTIETHHYFVCPHLVTEDKGYHVRFMATGTDMANYFGGR